MPKRKGTVEYYTAKIRKFQKESERRRRHSSDTSFTDTEIHEDVGAYEEYPIEGINDAVPIVPVPELEWLGEPLLAPEPEPVVESELTSVCNQAPSLIAKSPVTVQPEEPSASTVRPDLDELDPILLSALGDATEDTPAFGEKIHNSLAQRWTPILKKGLSKETKTKLMDEYRVPDNCRLLRAPTLNPEISAAVAELVRNRDKSILTKQDQLGHGITAINNAISLLLTSEDKVKAIRILSDSCRLLTDLHYTETQLRTKLITPCLQKSILCVIENQDRDETLFGVDLPEKIKSSKAIERQGHQLKKVSNKPVQCTTQMAPRSCYPENWQGPPRYPSTSRAGRGGQHRPRAPQYRRPPTTSASMTSLVPFSQNKQQALRH